VNISVCTCLSDFIVCYFVSVTKTSRAYTWNEGCWLFCYLPVKIRMPSYLLFIYLMEFFFSCSEASQFCGSVQGDSKRWTQLNSNRHLNTRLTVAVFQVLCLLYGLTCVGYTQNSLEFVSHSPLIHVVGWSFCLYTDSLFAQIGDSNDKCCSSLEIEC